MAIASGNRRNLRIRNLKAAFDRIEEGDFGYCIECDETIAEKRLEADPAPLLCVSCAAAEKRPLAVPGGDEEHGAAVLEAILQSAEAGRTVNLSGAGSDQS